MTLRDFFRWWGGQLSELLRLPYQHRADAAMDCFVVAIDGASGSLGRRRGGVMHDLGKFPIDQRSLERARHRMGRQHHKLMLQVDPQFLLERDLTLPIAAADDPAAVIRYDIDRLTPFDGDEVFWEHRVISLKPEQQNVVVRLSLVARSAVKDAILQLGQMGLPVRGLSFRLPDGGWRDILVTEEPQRHSAFDRMALRFSVAIVAFAFLISISIPIARTEIRLADVESKIENLRPLVAEVDMLRRDLAIVRAEQTTAVSAGYDFSSPLLTLANLTDILPDDTYITELSISSSRITLRGQSGNAARLIGLLSAERFFHSVIFAAPVTHAADDMVESFTIQADMGVVP